MFSLEDVDIGAFKENLKDVSDKFFMELSEYLINEDIQGINGNDLYDFFRGYLKDDAKRKLIESEIMQWIKNNSEKK